MSTTKNKKRSSTLTPNDQRSIVKNKTSREYTLDKINTVKQIKTSKKPVHKTTKSKPFTLQSK